MARENRSTRTYSRGQASTSGSHRSNRRLLDKDPQFRLFPVDLEDGTLFGNDAGEDELPELLASYFVDQPSFVQFFRTSTPFQIARSRKGMGKSAMLSKLAYDLKHVGQDNPIVIQTTGADLLGLAHPERYDYLSLQNYWKMVLCSRVNIELGKDVGFAFSDTAMALVQNAEISGFKERNIVGSLLSRIKSSKIPIEVILPSIGNHEELLRRALVERSDKKVWLLIDDIDATFVNNEQQRAVVSTFFSACRVLVREVKDLHIRASVRTDVWTTFFQNEDLDKCEQYVTDIAWPGTELKAILSKKIYSYLVRTYPNFAASAVDDFREEADRYIEWVFERRIRWGQAHVPPFIAIRVLSAGRPRWMAQLCRLSGQATVQAKQQMIGGQQINSTMKRYVRLRLNDLYKEHSHQFADLQKLIETFSGRGVKFTSAAVTRELQNRYVVPVGVNNIPLIDGYAFKYAVQLAHFLFKIGFLSARREQGGDAGGADFVPYEERPELLTDFRNLDDGMTWEIYPSYRLMRGLKDVT